MSYQGEDIFSAPATNSAILATSGVEMVEATSEDQVEPFRLYRFLAPPGLVAKGDRSIVFQGYVAELLNHVRHEVTGLWWYAYLNDKLDVREDQVEAEAALWS
jgi:hypothetical protein